MMIPDMDGAELSTLPAEHVLKGVDHSEAVAATAPPVNKTARNDDFHDGRYGISMSRRHERQDLKERTRRSSPNFPIFDPCRIEGDESVCVVWQECAGKAGQGGLDSTKVNLPENWRRGKREAKVEIWIDWRVGTEKGGVGKSKFGGRRGEGGGKEGNS